MCLACVYKVEKPRPIRIWWEPILPGCHKQERKHPKSVVSSLFQMSEEGYAEVEGWQGWKCPIWVVLNVPVRRGSALTPG